MTINYKIVVFKILDLNYQQNVNKLLVENKDIKVSTITLKF